MSRAWIGVLLLLSSCANRRSVDPSLFDPHADHAPGVLHLHATYTAPYCGGAEPDPSEWPRTQPWQGSMYIRRAAPDSTGRFALNNLSEPILDTIRTNADGHGWSTLPAGHYLLLDTDRVDRHKYKELLRLHAEPTMHTTPIDTACMRHWLHGPFGVVTITSGDTLNVELPLRDQCPWYATPCVHYFGPLPP